MLCIWVIQWMCDFVRIIFAPTPKLLLRAYRNEQIFDIFRFDTYRTDSILLFFFFSFSILSRFSRTSLASYISLHLFVLHFVSLALYKHIWFASCWAFLCHSFFIHPPSPPLPLSICHSVARNPCSIHDKSLFLSLFALSSLSRSLVLSFAFSFNTLCTLSVFVCRLTMNKNSCPAQNNI